MTLKKSKIKQEKVEFEGNYKNIEEHQIVKSKWKSNIWKSYLIHFIWVFI